MIRRHMGGIPQHALPPGFSLRWHRNGDRETWVRIHELAEKHVTTSAAVYDQQFEKNETELARRQAFLVDPNGQDIGTASAWFDDNFCGKRFGRVHWVAIIPQYQGKGLAKPLMTAILNRLVELGHDRAYLSTANVRLPAINLYLSFGFEPNVSNENDKQVWEEIQIQLQMPR